MTNVSLSTIALARICNNNQYTHNLHFDHPIISLILLQKIYTINYILITDTIAGIFHEASGNRQSLGKETFAGRRRDSIVPRLDNLQDQVAR